MTEREFKEYKDFIEEELDNMNVDELITIYNKYPLKRIGKIYYNHEHFVDNFCRSEKQIEVTYDLEAYDVKDPYLYCENDYLPCSIDKDEVETMAYRIINDLARDKWRYEEFKTRG